MGAKVMTSTFVWIHRHQFRHVEAQQSESPPCYHLLQPALKRKKRKESEKRRRVNAVKARNGKDYLRIKLLTFTSASSSPLLFTTNAKATLGFAGAAWFLGEERLVLVLCEIRYSLSVRSKKGPDHTPSWPVVVFVISKLLIIGDIWTGLNCTWFLGIKFSNNNKKLLVDIAGMGLCTNLCFAAPWI
ncbi:unnamed protein product [Vicia faba]|uniref:Uncharacterized protein n=1 Tax=Vicia faba TaxID=3906 RepID=A0AAV1AIR5_VICFA|nr:unnamed protein product [Vicia faba]